MGRRQRRRSAPKRTTGKACSAEASQLLADILEQDAQALMHLEAALERANTALPLADAGRWAALQLGLSKAAAALEGARRNLIDLLAAHKAQLNANTWWAICAYNQEHSTWREAIELEIELGAEEQEHSVEETCKFLVELLHDIGLARAIAKEAKRLAEGGRPRRRMTL